MSAKQPRIKKQTGRAEPAPSHAFDAELAEIAALGEQLRSGAAPTSGQVEYLRRMLAHRNNFLVSKAALLVANSQIAALLPEILASFERFFVDAVKSDPQCWAKNALAKALVKLEHRAKDTYLRGMRHHQLEPVWGGQSDTAGALRATCTHALVDCPSISDAELLAALLAPLTDSDKTVRMEAARAIAGVGGVSAALLLRMRAMLDQSSARKEEPEVLGAVFSALLSLEGEEAIPLVAKALEDGDDTASEAAFALADLRSKAALAVLVARQRAGADAWFNQALLSAIALTRLPEGFDFLLALITRDDLHAPAAIEALARIAPSADVQARIEQAVQQADSMRLRDTLRKHFPH
jgi:hypothetical protein